MKKILVGISLLLSLSTTVLADKASFDEAMKDYKEETTKMEFLIENDIVMYNDINKTVKFLHEYSIELPSEDEEGDIRG